MDERVIEWRELLVRKIRMLAVGLTSVVLPLSLLTGGITPLAQAAAPAIVPLSATGALRPIAVAPVLAGTLDLNPVANAKGGSITAKFTGADKVKNRPVYLLKSRDKLTWTKVGTKVKLSSSGIAVFKVTPASGTWFKAAAPAYTHKVKAKKVTARAVETPSKDLAATWKFQPKLSDDFGGKSLDSSKWKPTLQGDSGGGKRWCSVPWDRNSSVSKGSLKLTMSRLSSTSALAKSIVAKAKARQKAAKQKVVGCPQGVFLNARVSNEHSTDRISTGIVAAEITFPIYQGGHGGIWLRTASNAKGKFDEIDIVEAFGWKKGLQSVLHIGTPAKAYETPEAKKWVAKKAISKSSWWGKSHVFSVEFTRTKVIYRIDGAVTRTDKRALPSAKYAVVMSMLSSDWETGRLAKPVKGGKKGVKLPMSTSVHWVKAWTKAA